MYHTIIRPTGPTVTPIRLTAADLDDLTAARATLEAAEVDACAAVDARDAARAAFYAIMADANEALAADDVRLAAQVRPHLREVHARFIVANQAAVASRGRVYEAECLVRSIRTRGVN